MKVAAALAAAGVTALAAGCGGSSTSQGTTTVTVTAPATMTASVAATTTPAADVVSTARMQEILRTGAQRMEKALTANDFAALAVASRAFAAQLQRANLGDPKGDALRLKAATLVAEYAGTAQDVADQPLSDAVDAAWRKKSEEMGQAGADLAAYLNGR